MTATKTTPSARKRRRDWRAKFIAALESEGTVLSAARVAGVNRSTVYRERQANEEFALAWADAEEAVTEGLERKAAELAMAGEVRLIEFLLKARRPERYRENVKVEHAGEVSQRVRLDLRKLDTEDLERLEQIAAKLEDG